MYCGRIILLLLMACGMAESWWWWGKHEPWHGYDRVGRETKMGVLNITHELVVDAYQRYHQLTAIKESHYSTTEYQVGFIMGEIREKYRRMMEHYYQWRDTASGKAEFPGPGVRKIYPLHFIMTMEHITIIEQDIRKRIEGVLNYFKSDALPDYVPEKKSKSKPRKKPKKRSEPMRQEEQALKKSFRSQYLARRLGMPANYTTRNKRFQDMWPVEDTWDNFGPYDVGL